MVWLGKLFGILVVTALTNVDVLKIGFGLGWPGFWGMLLGLFLCFLVVNLIPNWRKGNFSRLGIMLGGETLMEICTITLFPDLLAWFCSFQLLLSKLSHVPPMWGILLHVLLCFLVLGILAWNGILRMYVSSVQLGIKWRGLFLILWWLP